MRTDQGLSNRLIAEGIGETAWVLDFTAPSDFVRAYPVSREWLTLLIHRMDAVASIYRLAAPRTVTSALARPGVKVCQVPPHVLRAVILLCVRR